MDTKSVSIESLTTDRLFPPPEDFKEHANINDPSVYERAESDPEAFWAELANELHWYKKWDKVLESDHPYYKWFVGGKLNVSYNCLDRHITTSRKNKAAIIWEGEPGDSVVLTYWDLYREVNKFANVLMRCGVGKGDRVAIYMPMIPELPIAMLACARIGASHNVVFGGFSALSLRDRMNDSEAKILITADGGYRRGKVVALKANADEALDAAPSIEKVIVVERVGEGAHVEMEEGRDFWWHDLMRDAPLYAKPEEMDAEDKLFLLYTSGTTGKPKGIVHTTGGYLVGVYATAKYVFDFKEEDTYFCTADIGWVTGHSYMVYGTLSNGATTVMYEGAPDYPDKDRFWEIIEKYGVTIFYTAPTAIRTFMKWGDGYPAKHDLSTLRLLGSVGEPINPEAWMWYHKVIGNEKCPIVDTWWQTETGSIIITPLPGITPLKPGSATKTFPGIVADIFDEEGNSVETGTGYLVLKNPWPAMLRNVYKNPERYEETYWSRYPGVYFTGDSAMRDKDGYIWILGRVDDVMNVSGHRLSTMEIESALVDHESVAESAVVGKADEMKGQAIVAFVTLKEGVEQDESLAKRLSDHVRKLIGPIAKPDKIIFTSELPKTRSGKIMRRLLRDVAEGRALGDTTTLADPEVVGELKEKYAHLEE